MRFKIWPVANKDYKVDPFIVDKIDNDCRYFMESALRFGFVKSINISPVYSKEKDDGKEYYEVFKE